MSNHLSQNPPVHDDTNTILNIFSVNSYSLNPDLVPPLPCCYPGGDEKGRREDDRIYSERDEKRP